MLEPGTIIDGKYRVVQLLGKGGMGSVYEGHNLRIDRRIAIKVMHASIAQDHEHVARFEREAQAAARIGSSHIVDVFDLGDLPSGERFMIMEYIEGESLMARLRTRERFPAAEVAKIGVQLLDGLAKVHEAGIVHRDLKPGNVFLARTESGGDFVKILDFGICKILQDRTPGVVSTGVGDLIGTPSYMSPEQLEHGPKGLDGRADLYAVGVILYRAISGQLPYQASSLVELLFKLREGKIVPIGETVEVDKAFAAIVTRAIEWDRDARFQTAREFQAALTDWLSTTTRVERLLTDFLEVPPVENRKLSSAPPRAASVAPMNAPSQTRQEEPMPMPMPARSKLPKLPRPSTPPKRQSARRPAPEEAVATKKYSRAELQALAKRATRRINPSTDLLDEETPVNVDFDEDAQTIPKATPRGPKRG